jgi:hypothetical protein
LTGRRFRHRVEAVVERFSNMQADLDRERMTMMRLWAKREEQIRRVVESTAGPYGDLQGIAGRSLLEIDGLELPLLDGPAADAAQAQARASWNAFMTVSSLWLFQSNARSYLCAHAMREMAGIAADPLPDVKNPPPKLHRYSAVTTTLQHPHDWKL